MSKPKSLTRRQRAVIEDLLGTEMDEASVLESHNVTPVLYSQWLTDERFATALERRIAQAHHAARIRLARAAVKAADKLIGLTKADAGETTRKACLDIIAAEQANAPAAAITALPSPEPAAPLPPETASRILALLAEPHIESHPGT